MIVAHFSANDTSSTGLVLGMALMSFGALRVRRGQRALGLKMVLTGGVALAVGIGTAFVHA